jgi:hypothetical protein
LRTAAIVGNLDRKLDEKDRTCSLSATRSTPTGARRGIGGIGEGRGVAIGSSLKDERCFRKEVSPEEEGDRVSERGGTSAYPGGEFCSVEMDW